jgi:uncharacterized LabA/DUF88 family protein
MATALTLVFDVRVRYLLSRSNTVEGSAQPHVFRRESKERKSKGVDITLTKDLLVNAFQDNYDVAVLIAGDGRDEGVELSRRGGETR